MPELVIGRVYNVCFSPIPSGRPVLHLFQYDGPISNDGVGVGFDPQVCGADSQQLGGGDGSWGLCGQQEIMEAWD